MKIKMKEEQFASRKQPRSQTTEENEAKKKNSLLWGRGFKMATQAIPPTPVATVGPDSRAWEFSGNLDGFKTRRQVLVTKSADGSFVMVT
jgi:hypothetical protein